MDFKNRLRIALMGLKYISNVYCGMFWLFEVDYLFL